MFNLTRIGQLLNFAAKIAKTLGGMTIEYYQFFQNSLKEKSYTFYKSIFIIPKFCLGLIIFIPLIL